MDNVARIYPLTAAQKGLLYQTLLSETDSLYRTQSRDNVFGPFSSTLFRQALEFLVHRHESLRCLFLHEGLDEPAVVVREAAELPWQEHDLTALTPDQQHARLDQIAQDCMSSVLALDSAPLFRVTVAKLSDEHSQVVFDIHHLIFDGWSSVLFFNELQIVYAALRDGYEPNLPVAGKFSDYAVQLSSKRSSHADQESASSAIMDDVQTHWMEKLSGFETPTSLQLDRPLDRSIDPGSGEGQFTNSSYHASLDARTTQALNELARTARVTMSTITEAAWALTLSRYNNTDDVVVGVTLNGRSSSLQNHERTFGMFVNALPLRLQCASRLSLFAWLDAAQNEKALLTQNENASMADIHLASELPAGVDLFDALLVFQTFPDLSGDGAAQTPAIGFSSYHVHENSPLPLLIDIFHGEQLNFMAMYIKERLPEQAVDQLMGHYLNLLRSMAAVKSPHQARLAELQMLSEADRQRLIHDWNPPVQAVPDTQTLHSAFLQQAAETPEALAVKDENDSLSYRELEEASGHVSRYLRACGVRPGDAVAICLERTVRIYPAILGILRAGALFVPVDPGYPAHRQNHMLKDCQTRIVLSSTTTQKVFEVADLQVIDLDAQWSEIEAAGQGQVTGAGTESAPGLDAVRGAYIMYTSGSTGLAKGVIGSHEATMNRFQWMWNTYPFDSDERCCQKTSMSFVDSIWELLGPLLKGVPTLILSDDVVRNVHRFVDVLEQEKISRVVLLPSYLSIVLDSVEDVGSHLAALRLCSVSGEPLSRGVARQFVDSMQHCTLLNLYGSTEVSGDVTAMPVGEREVVQNVPIGRPIDHCQVYILDADLQLMPPGSVGELCVAGTGVSDGYFGENEGLNRDKFIDNPFGPGKLFRTGDRGRHLHSGVIEHHGRSDGQLKIRGYRIEPAEIERVVASFEGIRAVLLNAPGHNKLHVYYRVRKGASVDAEALQAWVEERLPDYMVPQVLMEIDTFPRLPNGKISRKDLPDPTITQAKERVPPRTETETVIAQIWQKVLGCPDPSIYDNFVASGGTSLSGMRFNARIFREYGKTVLPRMLLTANLAQIAAYINPEDAFEEPSRSLDVDLMEPLYFGESGKRLFGVLHVPSVARPEAQAVLLCPSIGHEYMRLHRGYQMLAVDLARKGYHVLRFDLFGMGDSEGESSEATLAQWEEDVRTAARLLMQRSGAQTITSVGVRMGAPVLIGAELDCCNHLILWDPVCSGVEFLTHLDQLHRYAMKNLDRFRFRQYRSKRWERFGYTYSEQLSKQISALTPEQLNDKLPDTTVSVVTTDGVPEYNVTGIAGLLSREGIHHRHVADLNLWFNFDQASYLAFVQSATNAIADLIEG